MKLSVAELEALRDAARSITRGSTEADRLAALGLCEAGEGRYGSYCRITEAGRQFLATLAQSAERRLPSNKAQVGGSSPSGCTIKSPAGVPGSAKAEHLLRGTAARLHANAESDARVPAAILSPAAAQDVGTSSSQGGEGRRSREVEPRYAKPLPPTPMATADVGHRHSPSGKLLPVSAAVAAYIAPRTRRGT